MSTHAEYAGEPGKGDRPPHPSPARIWILAARPKTLPVGLAPVLVGTALAIQQDAFRFGPFLAALFGALFIQVGANLANDYSDARRGADSDDRLGPLRVTAGELVPPRQVLLATYLTFGVAVLCGIYLIVVAGWIILAIGAASIVAGLLYTGGPRPYGYAGLGELFVFLFFGLVAVTGTHYALTEDFDPTALALAVPVGLMAAAVLVVNNVRDIDTDRRAHKNTLAVRFGRERTRLLYAAMHAAAYVVTALIAAIDLDLSLWVLIALLSIPLSVRLVQTVSTHTDGPTLNEALAGTGRLELVFCVLLSAGILLS